MQRNEESPAWMTWRRKTFLHVGQITGIFLALRNFPLLMDATHKQTAVLRRRTGTVTKPPYANATRGEFPITGQGVLAI
jgi:hypothetical protein